MKINWLSVAAFMGALVVALGAFGAHALKGKLDAYGESIYAKAVLYQMLHVAGLLAVGLISRINPEIKIDFSGWAFCIGIVLFSGSLYVMAMTGVKWLGAITPLGGLSFIAGWLYMAFRGAKF